jgi:hypothetical protein
MASQNQPSTTPLHENQTKKIYEGGRPSPEAAKQGAQPTVADAASTTAMVNFARSLRAPAPA